MAGNPKLVPIKLADIGTFKGHQSGPFELTAKTFDQIVENFNRAGLLVPIDAEHASEQPATEGSVPVNGAPAMGWIHKLENRGNGGLWGLVEWLEPAKSYIKEGRYKYLSPAIRLRSRDTVTGEPIGARLSSAAITNTPFLRTLGVLAAKDAAQPGATVQAGAFVMLTRMTDEERVAQRPGAQLALKSSGLAFPPSEYMPRIKSALRLSEVHSPLECSEHLARLRSMHDADAADDDDGVHDGVALDDFRVPLRNLVGATPAQTWDDVFDAVENMIDAAIGRHVAEYHETQLGADGARASGAITADDAPTDTGVDDQGDTTMAASEEKISQLEGDKATLLADKKTLTTVTETLTAEKKTLSDRISALESTYATEKTTLLGQKDSLETEKTKLALQVQELSGNLAKITEELKTLKDGQAKREEDDREARVLKAFDDWKDKKNLREESKKGLLLILKNDPTFFETEYPIVKDSERHLLSTKTVGRREPPPPPMPRGNGANAAGAGPRTTLLSVAQSIAKEKKISLSEAMVVADEVWRRNRAASVTG